MAKTIENKQIAAPIVDGKSNETTTVLPAGRNGKPTTEAKAKAEAEAEAEKAKAKAIVKAKQLAEADKKAKAKAAKAKAAIAKSGFQLIALQFNGKKSSFLYKFGINTTDFVQKNFELLKMEDKKIQTDILNRCFNYLTLKNPTASFSACNGISKARARYNKETGQYDASVSARFTLKRRPTKTEASEQFEKEETTITKSLADRRKAFAELV